MPAHQSPKTTTATVTILVWPPELTTTSLPLIGSTSVTLRPWSSGVSWVGAPASSCWTAACASRTACARSGALAAIETIGSTLSVYTVRTYGSETAAASLAATGRAAGTIGLASWALLAPISSAGTPIVRAIWLRSCCVPRSIPSRLARHHKLSAPTGAAAASSDCRVLTSTCVLAKPVGGVWLLPMVTAARIATRAPTATGSRRHRRWALRISPGERHAVASWSASFASCQP